MRLLKLTHVDGDHIIFPAVKRLGQGESGFGFDPVFIPEGHSKTYAEMSDIEKNSISHRRKALEQVSVWLKENL